MCGCGLSHPHSRLDPDVMVIGASVRCAAKYRPGLAWEQRLHPAPKLHCLHAHRCRPSGVIARAERPLWVLSRGGGPEAGEDGWPVTVWSLGPELLQPWAGV